MKETAGLVGKLSPEEITEIKRAGVEGVLSRAALNALDRAAGGGGMGHGYYVSTGTADENGDPEFMLHPQAAAEVFGSSE